MCLMEFYGKFFDISKVINILVVELMEKII